VAIRDRHDVRHVNRAAVIRVPYPYAGLLSRCRRFENPGAEVLARAFVVWFEPRGRFDHSVRTGVVPAAHVPGM
jgi:hypothetical protein